MYHSHSYAPSEPPLPEKLFLPLIHLHPAKQQTTPPRSRHPQLLITHPPHTNPTPPLLQHLQRPLPLLLPLPPRPQPLRSPAFTLLITRINKHPRDPPAQVRLEAQQEQDQNENDEDAEGQEEEEDRFLAVDVFAVELHVLAVVVELARPRRRPVVRIVARRGRVVEGCGLRESGGEGRGWDAARGEREVVQGAQRERHDVVEIKISISLPGCC